MSLRCPVTQTSARGFLTTSSKFSYFTSNSLNTEGVPTTFDNYLITSTATFITSKSIIFVPLFNAGHKKIY